MVVDKNTAGNSPDPASTEEELQNSTTEGQEANVNNDAGQTAETDANADGKKDADSAESSNAGKEPDAKDKKAPARKLLDVVKDAVDKPPGGKKEASSTSGDKKGADGVSDKNPKKKDGEDLPPFHEHPRWQEQLKKNDENERKIKELEPAAAQYQLVDGFMQENKLGPREAAEGLKIAALLQNYPMEALKLMEHHSENIRLHFGLKLPNDLQEQVDNGSMTEEAAKELQKTRNENLSLKSTVNIERAGKETVTKESDANALATLKREVGTAVTQWEKEQLSKDPDYSVKQPLVTDRVKAIVQERKYGFTSVEDAKAVADQALKDVTKNLGKILPARKPMNRLSPAGKEPVSTEPKTLGEAIRRGVKRA